jgi:DNA-binding MarR family transcriptional regulator
MFNSEQIDTSEYQALAEFRYQIRRFVRFSEDAARDSGVEPQQHQLMLAVKGGPDGEATRIAYLAERLQIQHHSAVELIDRLVNKGMLKRKRGSEDRREVHVGLTAKGERVLDELTRHTRAEIRTAAPALVETLRKLARPAKLRTERGSATARTRRHA